MNPRKLDQVNRSVVLSTVECEVTYKKEENTWKQKGYLIYLFFTNWEEKEKKKEKKEQKYHGKGT